MSHPHYKVPMNLVGLCSCASVLYKVELVKVEIGYLAEAISRQIVESEAWILLTVK